MSLEELHTVGLYTIGSIYCCIRQGTANNIFSSIGSINGNLVTTEAFTFIKVAIVQSVLQPLNDCVVWWVKNDCHRDFPCILMRFRCFWGSL